MGEVNIYLALIFLLSISYSCSHQIGTKENEAVSQKNNSSLDSNNSNQQIIPDSNSIHLDSTIKKPKQIASKKNKLHQKKVKSKPIESKKTNEISESALANKDTLQSKKTNSSTQFVKNKQEGQFGTGHSGDDDLHGSGIGVPGPGQSARFGKIDHGEGTPPTKINNPTKTESGKVAIELTVDKEGKILFVKVLANHRMTTTTDPVLFRQAKKDGYKFKFSPNPKREELSKAVRIINYTIQD